MNEQESREFIERRAKEEEKTLLSYLSDKFITEQMVKKEFEERYDELVLTLAYMDYLLEEANKHAKAKNVESAGRFGAEAKLTKDGLYSFFVSERDVETRGNMRIIKNLDSLFRPSLIKQEIQEYAMNMYERGIKKCEVSLLEN